MQTTSNTILLLEKIRINSLQQGHPLIDGSSSGPVSKIVKIHGIFVQQLCMQEKTEDVHPSMVCPKNRENKGATHGTNMPLTG